MSSTLKLAREVAQLIDRDTIMAAQLKNELGADRLYEILNLERPEKPEDKDEKPEESYEDNLDAVVANYDISDVLAAFRKAGKN